MQRKYIWLIYLRIWPGNPILTHSPETSDFRLIRSIILTTLEKEFTPKNDTILFINHYIFSWEPRGRHHQLSVMFPWEQKGSYRCTKSMAIAPFWFSMEHQWTALTPFWFSADDITNNNLLKYSNVILKSIRVMSCRHTTLSVKINLSLLQSDTH